MLCATTATNSRIRGHTVEPVVVEATQTAKRGSSVQSFCRCAFALLCSATIAEKVDFMHSLFDFGLDGDLHLPEVTILVRTALIACAKVRELIDVGVIFDRNLMEFSGEMGEIEPLRTSWHLRAYVGEIYSFRQECAVAPGVTI